MAAKNDVLHVVAHLTAKPAHASEVRALLLHLLDATRREPGCLQYDLLVDETDPARFTFVEQWTDSAALEAHFRTPHYLTAGEQVGPLLTEPPQIMRYNRIA